MCHRWKFSFGLISLATVAPSGIFQFKNQDESMKCENTHVLLRKDVER